MGKIMKFVENNVTEKWNKAFGENLSIFCLKTDELEISEKLYIVSPKLNPKTDLSSSYSGFSPYGDMISATSKKINAFSNVFFKAIDKNLKKSVFRHDVLADSLENTVSMMAHNKSAEMLFMGTPFQVEEEDGGKSISFGKLLIGQKIMENKDMLAKIDDIAIKFEKKLEPSIFTKRSFKKLIGLAS